MEKLAGIRWDEWPKQRSRSPERSEGTGAEEQGTGEQRSKEQGTREPATLLPCDLAPLSGNLYFQADSVSIYHDDFLSTECVEENSIDLIVTSPPYNVDVKYGSYDDDISYEVYLEFTREWLARCLKLAKDDGRFCLNVPLDKNKGGQQSVCADITTIAKQVGWKYHSTIIWNEQNISRRTAWGSWLSASAPYVIAPVEVILVLYKKRWKKTGGSKRSDITREEFMEWTNGVWNFSGESRKRVGHPAPFPVELPRRCIKLFTFVGDTVLDPFLGSGSTLIACVETNREGIGIEIDSNYCEIAKQRLIAEGRVNQGRLL
ncbi:MAG: site-specific DNA-methyltransferase [Chloroflexi bacterium]|nr:site-specific DNA-methyltransferase [Chloroflexota bacterium]